MQGISGRRTQDRRHGPYALRSTVCAVALLCAAAPVGALAQTAATPAPAESDSASLSEVVITAQRYKQNLQTTPIAVTALSATMLAQHRVTNVLDAGAQIPGVTLTPVTGASSGSRIIMRGAGQENTGILFDPAVGTYIDNVYQPRLNGGFFDFFDIERLEVLRGPQGTLYGRNTSGGAIKIVTKRPSFDLTYAGDVALGTYGMADIRGYVSGPLIGDTLAGSLSAVSRKRNGWTTAPAYGRKVNNKDTLAVRGKLLWKPSDALDIEAAYDLQHDGSDPAIGVPLQVPASVGNTYAVPGRALDRTELSGPAQNKVNSNGGSINASYTVSPSVQLTSITGYRLMRITQIVPLWQTAGSPIGSSYNMRDRFLSQEFNAAYSSDRFKGLVGLFYFKEDGHEVDALPYNAVTPGGGAKIMDRTTKAAAVFAQGSYTVGAGVSVTGGLRYTEEKAQMTQFYYAQTANPQPASKTFSGLSPKIGVDWKIDDGLMAYASYTKGFKSGGFNAVPFNANTGPGVGSGRPIAYDSEKAASYEVGVKLQTADRRLRLNTAIFSVEYDGFQLPVLIPGTTTSITSNAARARVRGIELEPTWQATDTLNLYGNLSLSQSKYLSAFTCSTQYGVYVNCQNRKLKGVAPVKSLLGVNYSPVLPIPGAMRFNLDWQHSAKYYNNGANEGPLVQTRAYDLFNGGISWDAPGDHWTVALEGKNIFNKRFILAGLQLANPVTPTVTGYPNDPRMIDLRISARF